MFVVFLLGPVRGPFPFMKQTPVRSHPPEEVVLQMRKQDESLEIVVMHYVPWAFEFRSTKGWWGQWPSAALVVALVQRWWYEMVDVCRSRFLEARRFFFAGSSYYKWKDQNTKCSIKIQIQRWPLKSPFETSYSLEFRPGVWYSADLLNNSLVGLNDLQVVVSPRISPGGLNFRAFQS